MNCTEIKKFCKFPAVVLSTVLNLFKITGHKDHDNLRAHTNLELYGIYMFITYVVLHNMNLQIAIVYDGTNFRNSLFHCSLHFAQLSSLTINELL